MFGEVADSVYLPFQLVFYLQQRLLCSGWQVWDRFFGVGWLVRLGLFCGEDLGYAGWVGVKSVGKNNHLLDLFNFLEVIYLEDLGLITTLFWGISLSVSSCIGHGYHYILIG